MKRLRKREVRMKVRLLMMMLLMRMEERSTRESFPQAALRTFFSHSLIDRSFCFPLPLSFLSDAVNLLIFLSLFLSSLLICIVPLSFTLSWSERFPHHQLKILLRCSLLSCSDSDTVLSSLLPPPPLGLFKAIVLSPRSLPPPPSSPLP